MRGAGNDIGNGTSVLVSTLSSPLSGVKCLHGELIIDVANFNFVSLNLQMDIDAKITINTGKSLTVDASNIYSCDQLNMWRTIEVNANSTLILIKSNISDAQKAVSTSPNSGALLQMTDVVFNKNYGAISIDGNISSTSFFTNVDFSCATTIGGSTPALLLAPYSSSRSLTGLSYGGNSSFNFTNSSPNFTFRAFNIAYGISIRNAGITLNNSKFTNCGTGIFGLRPLSQTITDCTFLDCNNGIFYQQIWANGIRIENNEFHNFRNYGVFLNQPVNGDKFKSGWQSLCLY